ncbi:MAG: S9 family peptidase [Caulobacteraceae bacterium]|nr:S9 family peptidase [Caulobacteraceae bacterium]
MKTATGIFAAVCAVALLFGPPATAQSGKTVLTHETLWMMKRVGEPAVSPDGKWVVVSVVEPSYEADKQVSDLWLVPSDGSAPPRRITHTKEAESGVAWSPDSRQIAFATKREGDDVDQIYVLDLVGGGEARRVTEVSTGAANPKWRPDGKAILFESQAWPGALDDSANRKAAADHKARKYNVRIYEHYPVRYWNRWLDDRHPTVMVQPLEAGAPAHDILTGTKLSQTPGFFGAEGDERPSLSPVWSPDGSEILFVATTERWNASFAHVGYHIYAVAASGGEPRVVTATNGWYGAPTFSPDGRWLYFKFEPQDAQIYHLAHLERMAWPGSAATELTTGFDREIDNFAIEPDGKTVWMLVPEAGREGLYRLDAAGGRPRAVIQPETGGYESLHIADHGARPVMIARWGSSVSPLEVVRIDPAARRHTNLTSFDVAEAASIDWSPPQHFWFASRGGRRIHNMIVLPPHFDPAKKYPLLVMIHGGAASTNPDQIGLRWNYHLLAAPGYVVLMTDYTGSTGEGEAFAQAIKGDPLKTPGEEIMQGVDEALARYPFIDGSRMCAAGASYGGHLTYWLEATTTRFKCLISHAGEVDLVSQWGTSDGDYEREVTNGGSPWEGSPIWHDQSPITYAAHWKTPILLSVGERDFRVPINNTLEAWAVLQREQVPSRLLVWPDAWHWIMKPEDSRHFYEEVHAWLARYLQPGTSAPSVPAAVQ